MFDINSLVRGRAARRALALLVVGVLGVSCSSASISDETDSGIDPPADQAGETDGDEPTSPEDPADDADPAEQDSSDDGDTDGEATGEGQNSGSGFSLDGEPIVVVSDNVDCVISPRVIVEPANPPSIADVQRGIGVNVPKSDPEHCYLFSAEIPDDLRRYHADVHQKLIDYVGGYDRYIHITYEVEGDNTEALEILDQFGYFYDNNGQPVEPSIDLVYDRRSCLSGFGRDGQWDGYNDFSFCNQPNPLTDPMWEWDVENFGPEVFMYNTINGWVHEYYHHVQGAHTLGRSLGMPADCCGGRNHTGSPAWFVEGQAQVFPTLFLRDVFDDLQITKDLGLEGACAGDPRLNGNGPGQPLWERVSWQTNCNMTQKFESASRAIRGEGDEWEECTGFSALDEMRETWICPGHMEILNFYLAYLTSFETLFIGLHEDVWALGFEGALDKHFGLTKDELYEQFNQFMRDNPSPPEDFFPTERLDELVDFWGIESGVGGSEDEGAGSDDESAAGTDSESDTSPAATRTDEIRILAASSVDDETLDYLNTYIDYSVEHFFSDPRLVQDDLYPIIVLQYDRNNLETIYDLEDRYCSLMSTFDTDTFLNSRCNPNNRGDCADNICLLTHDGEPVGSSISGTPGTSCCYLFISDSFDANDRTSLAYVTLHEMFHIFQISNYVEYESWEHDDAYYISGKISGDGTEHKPWWMEGNAVYFSHLHYSRATGDFEHLNREMERGLWTPYGPSGEDVIDRYLNGPELYNVTWESDWAVGYQVGAWFVAYVAHHEGEQAVIDFWINTQDGTRFPENFEQTFGTDYRTYVDEFEEFIRTSDRSEVMGILPAS